MNAKIIVSDFDGVIGDSLHVALMITRKIVDLFDTTETVNTFSDYYRLLGKKTELKNVTELDSATLRELYRIMHRHNSNKIKLFAEVLEIYSILYKKPLIVSSSYSDAIKIVLGDYQNVFDGIYGFELGHKKDILQKLKDEYEIMYITDTFRDVFICKNLNIPVIATTWGYDPAEKIKAENPNYIVSNFNELNKLLFKLNYLPKT